VCYARHRRSVNRRALWVLRRAGWGIHWRGVLAVGIDDMPGVWRIRERSAQFQSICSIRRQLLVGIAIEQG
jgi:hypothetical protein